MVSLDDGMNHALTLSGNEARFGREVTMQQKMKASVKAKFFDLQTASIFVALGALTVLFVMSVSWALGSA